MKVLTLFLFALLFGAFGDLRAQLASDIDSIQITSTQIRSNSYSFSGTSSSFFFIHTYKTKSMESGSWVGVYGGRLRPYTNSSLESSKYLNRFTGLSIGRQACLAVALPITGYIIYDAWTNDAFMTPNQISLMLVAALPITLHIVIPYFKKNTLQKFERAHNEGTLR